MMVLIINVHSLNVMNCNKCIVNEISIYITLSVSSIFLFLLLK